MKNSQFNGKTTPNETKTKTRKRNKQMKKIAKQNKQK